MRKTLLPFLLAALLAPACRGGKTDGPRAFPGAPVVLVCVDTLRSDRLPFYGYGKVETPALTALREEAVLFERAYSHVPLTLPAHASIFTGALPGAHGVLDNAGYRLPDTLPTLAELLSKEGYVTGAAVSSVVLAGSSGISRGFTLWNDAIVPERAGVPVNRVQRPGAETAEILARFVEERKDSPFFAFLHVYEPHAPYEAPEPFRSRFADPYDAEVAAADAAVGAFVAKLKALGLWEKSLVVFLSDHGEGLGEHGENEHGVFLYRESLQVPLLLKLPKGTRGGTSVAAPVQISDVFRTIVEAAGLSGAPVPAGLVNLVGLAYGEAAPERRIYAETFFPRIRFGWSELAALLDGSWHYVAAPKPEFYDLASDPGETRNLAGEKPGPFRSFVVETEKLRSPFRAPADVDPEHAKKLASLGYLSMTTAGGSEVRPNPKDEIGSLEKLKEGLGHLQADRPAEAVAALQQLLERNPRVLDAWELLAQALARLGRPDEALAAIRKTVELSPPDRTSALLTVAAFCLQVGRPDEALAQARAARDLGDRNADEVVARAELARGNVDAAETAARHALEGSPSSRPGALFALARAAALRGDVNGALARTEEVRAALGGRAEVASLQGFHALRGDLLARLGRVPEAEHELLTEIRLFPQALEARVALAAAYAASGRKAEAVRTIDEMVRLLPRPDVYATAVRALRAFEEPAAAARLAAAARARFPRDGRFARGG
ncbi:MAG TPA: sulfatase-like hydrolase/transferase [Thermoanaerobaculia bacterium]|nr:sulfatase-like hydrolase/transferase [Thermoanaerobaculia bacterium]